MKKLFQKYSDDKRSTELRPYNRGQRNEPSQYAFLQNLSDGEDDRDDGLYMQTRNEDFLEKELEPGDTLQTLSIQFNCPIAELKRVNNIHRENEVFARRIIKVPIKYYSLLSEKVAGVHKNRDTSASTSQSINDPPASTLAASFSINTLLKTGTESQDNLDLARVGEYYIRNKNPLEESDECLATSSLLSQNPNNNQSGNVFECNGSDWGLSWLHLLSYTLLFLFGGPIIYLLYHKVELTSNSSSPFVNNTSLNHTL